MRRILFSISLSLSRERFVKFLFFHVPILENGTCFKVTKKERGKTSPSLFSNGPSRTKALTFDQTTNSLTLLQIPHIVTFLLTNLVASPVLVKHTYWLSWTCFS